MNARIQELALEAFDPINAMASEGVADRHTFDQAWFQLYNKKFAELIVRGCVEIIETQRVPIRPSPSGEMAAKWTVDELRECRDKIKKHFGLEP